MFNIVDNKFILNGKETKIYSGAIHYFRVMPEYWEDRLLKLKLAGFNTVETYVCWNLHEARPNEYNFTGILDLRKFILTAQKIGLNVILRPGPYICAEWDLGGLPAWLLADKNMSIRCNDPKYMEHIKRYYGRLCQEISDLQITKGGNIIAMQVENEYGSYGNDKHYLNAIKDIMLNCGIDVLLFTSDGPNGWMLAGGTLEDVYTTLNFGSGASTKFKALDKYKNNGPKMCMEFWCGWFDHWNGKHHTRGYKKILKEIEAFFAQDASFNFYMFHGGTNFGFNAGANYYLNYTPTTTSYDYCAPLNEYGDYTPMYHAVRKLLCDKQGIQMQELPPSPKLQSIGEVALTECTGLFENMDNIGTVHNSPMPKCMEELGQNSGMILYETTIPHGCGLSAVAIEDLHDRAYIYNNGKMVKKIDFIKNNIVKKLLKRDALLINSGNDDIKLEILVDAMGHVNYGKHIYDRKGLSRITLNIQTLMNFKMTCLPLDNTHKLDFNLGAEKYPKFFKGSFDSKNNYDCFVELNGFTKGSVYINGFNIGRYWSVGPQKTLYIPGTLLHTDKANEIIILELEGTTKNSVMIGDKHKLG